MTVDLPAARGELYAEHFATRLLEHGLTVTTPGDVASVLSLERQKQLLECGDGASCILEIAGALGVKELVTGRVAKVDGGLLLVLKVLNSENAQVRFARTAQVDDERRLFATLDEWASLIAGKPAAARSLASLVPLGLGAAGVLVGAGFLVSAGADFIALGKRGDFALSLADAQVASARGPTSQLVGAVLVGAGAACLAAGVLWWLWSAPEEPRTTWLLPTHNGLALVGVLP